MLGIGSVGGREIKIAKIETQGRGGGGEEEEEGGWVSDDRSGQ